ncbi:hypothetical protein GALL_42590 [mine drainage metagenome]|uniref:Uncharacterized protein n=1 Tax=mine drainage metagenome TaxID=410659 RepID=A0A1J5TN74_9ZZZZ
MDGLRGYLKVGTGDAGRRIWFRLIPFNPFGIEPGGRLWAVRIRRASWLFVRDVDHLLLVTPAGCGKPPSHQLPSALRVSTSK